MEKKKQKNKKNDRKEKSIILLIVVITVIIGIIGITYAFFTANLGGQETVTTVTVTGGVINLGMDGGNSITVSNIIPQDAPVATKEFTVTGDNTTNDATMTYHLSLIVDENTFSSNAITYTLTAVNTSNSGTVAPNVTNQVALATGVGVNPIGTGSYSNSGTNRIHTYTLNIYFPNNPNVAQNEDQGKVFKAHVGLTGE